MNKVKRTEQNDQFLFRRKTILKYKDTIVVSTVGKFTIDNGNTFQLIGPERYYETMAWDLDSEKYINIDSDWRLNEMDNDDKANDMHETIVAEITKKLENEDVFEEL